jgi:hypothetical protein
MTDQSAEALPGLEARLAGFLYLLNTAAGAFIYGFVRSTTITPGDAGTTAANILQHALLYRLGFVARIVPVLCNVPLAIIFYDLFKVVNRSFSALVAFFILAAAIESANLLNYRAAYLNRVSGFPVGFPPAHTGVLMAVAGLCYLASSLASFLSPRFAAHPLPCILIPSTVGELALSLWLLVMGVDVENWSKQAYAA